MSKLTSSRFAFAAGWIVAAGAGMFGGIGSAFATAACVGASDDGFGICDITATVVQIVPPTAGVALSNSTQTNYVRYRVTLKHYADRREGFSQVKFVADTVVNATGAGAANIVETTAATVANNVGGALNNAATACGITTTHLECMFNFNSPGFDGDVPQAATITFDVTVQSPTASAAGSLDLITTTSYTEAGFTAPEPESFSLTSTSNLTVPDPLVVATYVPAAGTVKTGNTGGAATCVGGPTGNDPNKWVTIVKVPEAAQVGIDLNPFTDPSLPPGSQFFSTIGIPDLTDPLGAPKLFGVGTHWYDPGAASRLVVNTLRRDVCTVPGSDPIQKAAHILQEKIYYKPEGGQFQRVHLCIITSGPTPGSPCIAFAQVYTRFNLPNVPNKNDYLGDHEWVIFANENGKYVN